MIFINDIIPGLAWLTPAPIGTVEDGWAGIVSDLLRNIDSAIAARPGATLDVLAVAERDGDLLFDFALDGADAMLDNAVEAAVTIARTRAAATCAQCGQPGRLRRDRPGWPATRCDRHAGETTR